MITACYLRVSTESQNHSSQHSALVDYCARENLKEIIYFKDVAGGTKLRPELNKLITKVKEGSIKKVICYKLDRLGRSLSDLLSTIDIFNKFGCTFISVSDGINTSTDSPFGKLQLGILGSIAEFERGLIRERVMAGLAAARAQGKVGGRPGLPQATKDRMRQMLSSGTHPKVISNDVGTSVASVYKLKKQLALLS